MLMDTDEKRHLIFTDGSSLGNPGPGGWGAVIVLDGNRVIELGGWQHRTTNNRMELTALIEGLRRLVGEPGDVAIYLDSAYVMNGATRWSEGWKRRGWKTATKTDVEHRDLWEELLRLLHDREKFGRIIWNLVPGHAGIAGNERADAIATAFAAGERPELFSGSLADYAVDILHVAVDTRKLDLRKASKSRARAKAYSYLSLVNGRVMRHATWADCERRVKGKPGAKYKKTLSAEDERMILRSWGMPVKNS